MYLQPMPELQMMKQQHLIINWDYVWEKNMEFKFMELLYNIFIFFLLKGQGGNCFVCLIIILQLQILKVIFECFDFLESLHSHSSCPPNVHAFNDFLTIFDISVVFSFLPSFYMMTIKS